MLYLPPHLILESQTVVLRISHYLMTYPRTAHIHERKLGKPYIAPTLDRAYLTKRVTTLLTTRQYYDPIAAQDFLPMIPTLKDGPVVPTHDKHKLTLRITSRESQQRIRHIVRTWQSKLNIRDPPPANTTHSQTSKFKSQPVVPKTITALERILRADYEPKLIDHTRTHETLRHGGMPHVYRVETAAIDPRNNPGVNVIIHHACTLLFTKLGIIIEK